MLDKIKKIIDALLIAASVTLFCSVIMGATAFILTVIWVSYVEVGLHILWVIGPFVTSFVVALWVRR